MTGLERAAEVVLNLRRDDPYAPSDEIVDAVVAVVAGWLRERAGEPAGGHYYRRTCADFIEREFGEES